MFVDRRGRDVEFLGHLARVRALGMVEIPHLVGGREDLTLSLRQYRRVDEDRSPVGIVLTGPEQAANVQPIVDLTEGIQYGLKRLSVPGEKPDAQFAVDCTYLPDWTPGRFDTLANAGLGCVTREAKNGLRSGREHVLYFTPNAAVRGQRRRFIDDSKFLNYRLGLTGGHALRDRCDGTRILGVGGNLADWRSWNGDFGVNPSAHSPNLIYGRNWPLCQIFSVRARAVTPPWLSTASPVGADVFAPAGPRTGMPRVRRLAIDVLKPHEPPILKFTDRVAAAESVDGATVSLVELDQEVQNVKLTIEGEDLDYEAIEATIESLSGTVHSVDQVACGERLVEDRRTLQD
jgi:hypothetical protein